MAKFIEVMQPLCVVLVLGSGIAFCMLLAIDLFDLLFRRILGRMGIYILFLEFVATKLREKKMKRKIGGK